MGPVYIGEQTLVAVPGDVSHYAKNLFEYSQLYRAIESIFIKKYAKTETVKKYAENINSLKKSLKVDNETRDFVNQTVKLK